MTLLRGLALGISGRVVRWASPGAKQWAEGLAREGEFIPSDWRALGWALGSARVLLDRHEAPFGSLEAVTYEAREYRDSFGNRFKFATPYFLLLLVGGGCGY